MAMGPARLVGKIIAGRCWARQRRMGQSRLLGALVRLDQEVQFFVPGRCDHSGLLQRKNDRISYVGPVYS
jgi:hypothetical protein